MPAPAPIHPRGAPRRALRHAAVRQAGRRAAAVPASPRRRRGGCRAFRRWFERRPGKAGPRAGSRCAAGQRVAEEVEASRGGRLWLRASPGRSNCRQGLFVPDCFRKPRRPENARRDRELRVGRGALPPPSQWRGRRDGRKRQGGGLAAGRRPAPAGGRGRGRSCGARGQRRARFTLPGAFRRSPPAEGAGATAPGGREAKRRLRPGRGGEAAKPGGFPPRAAPAGALETVVRGSSELDSHEEHFSRSRSITG
ncbi:translation initiation factor IF-2-like isoform X2 [Aquila chrysaetos chrysaetos]|uniref:translation initiation factor IF-2-like isoform X2 n=1 Tax=Aquila chrysaetos chrysaetos TaxID=223781 RepID=UPI001B7D4217|nr:translation initiation factor IF-2-like isoform X2 [Aquila chrysaetos chrysaetos]